MFKSACMVLLVAGSSFLSLSLVNCLDAGTDNKSCTDAPVVSTVKFSFSSHKNQTGQWIIQVGVERTAEGKDLAKDIPWSLDVQRESITSCHRKQETVELSFKADLANLTSDTGVESPAQPNCSERAAKPGHELHSNATSWKQAVQTCADNCQRLLVLNSESEASAIQALAASHSFIWTGVYEKDGKYVTVAGASLEETGFQRWSPGEPNDPAHGNCLAVYRVNGGLADFSCDAAFPFVCESN